jgi:hypothetical protein
MNIFRYAYIYFIGLLFFPVILGASNPAVKPDDILLKVEKLPFTPKEFFIADVIDERKDPSAIAWLVPAPGSAKSSLAIQKVDLKGGGLTGIKQFISESMPANKKLRPIVIRLRELKISETTNVQNRVDGKVVIDMAFYLKRGKEEVHLLDYKGGAKYGRSVNQQGVVEPVLRQSLGKALNYLNTWMDQEVNINEKLAKGIKVTFTEPKVVVSQDTVYYNFNRPLTWKDFRAMPNVKSQYAASVFPGFGYKGSSKVVDGIIHLDLTLQVFMLQQSSWMKDVARNAYTLNHEQKHFDIVKIVSERFKKNIHPDSLSIEDYNSIIQYEYIESFREMNRLQEQYDGETRHGLDKEAQARWNRLIEKELGGLGKINE